MILKYWAIWLRSLTVEISHVPCTGEVVETETELETVWPFWECIIAKILSNVNFSENSFKFAMQKNALPINPLGPIVHGLYVSNDKVFSITAGVYERVGISLVEVYERVRKYVISVSQKAQIG